MARRLWMAGKRFGISSELLLLAALLFAKWGPGRVACISCLSSSALLILNCIGSCWQSIKICEQQYFPTLLAA